MFAFDLISRFHNQNWVQLGCAYVPTTWKAEAGRLLELREPHIEVVSFSKERERERTKSWLAFKCFINYK